MNRRRRQRTIWAELKTMGIAAFDPWSCFASKAALIIGLGYLFVPVDLIPANVPYFGHLDELAFALFGIAIARLLAPQDLLDGARVAPDDAPRPQAALWQYLGLLGEHGGPDLFRLIGYRWWWRLQSPIVLRSSDAMGIVVVGGAPRSGTTLLRSILGRHPLIASGPETTVFLHRISPAADIAPRLGWNPAMVERWQRESRSQVEFIERFHRAMLGDSGKPVWAEKTPANVTRFGFVKRHFPEARLVHIIRDGRDVVCSLRTMPFAKIDDAAPDSTDAALQCAMRWKADVTAGLHYRADPAYHELRYEDLVGEPEPTLRRLVEFLELPWSDALLDGVDSGWVSEQIWIPVHRFWPDNVKAAFLTDAINASSDIFASSIGRWRRDLAAKDVEALMPLIGALLADLGYQRG